MKATGRALGSARLHFHRQGPLAAGGDAGAQRLIGAEVGEAAAADRLHMDEDILVVLLLADEEAIALEAVEPFDPDRLEIPGIVEQGGGIHALARAGRRALRL